MNKNDNEIESAEAHSPQLPANNGPSRRKFLSQIGAALAGGAVFGKAAVASAQSYNPAIGDGVTSLPDKTDPRIQASFKIRMDAAQNEKHIPVPPHTTNGDEQRYPDKSGTYTKGILQDGIGLVNLAAFQTFRNAINTGTFAAFESVITGGTANAKWTARRPRFRLGRQR